MISRVVSIALNRSRRLVSSFDLQNRRQPFSSSCPKNKMEPNLVMTQLKPGDVVYPLFQKLKSNEDIVYLAGLLKEAGHEMRVAGGAVRDLLCGNLPQDVDFASTATPSQAIEILRNHEDTIRLITTKSGERHGTVIARVRNRNQFEITTLRVDRITDGRHAEVEFVTDWAQDASRRDLTINSMFLDLDGNIYDYFNGRQHLKQKLVKFVGDPVDRMNEDYLRILRYFRFYARYGDCEQVDEETFAAIEKCRDGLSQISGERIWTEIKKIVPLANAKFVLPQILNRLQLGVYMGMDSGNKNFDRFNQAYQNLHSGKFAAMKNGYESVNLISALIDSEEELVRVIMRLRWSNIEKGIAGRILELRDCPSVNYRSLIKRLVMTPKSELGIVRPEILEYLRHIGDFETYRKIRQFEMPHFPLSGNQLAKKVNNPRSVGKVLAKLKELWVDSDFALSEEDLLKKIDPRDSSKGNL